MGGTLTYKQLSDKIWSAKNILKEKVQEFDLKEYTLILFLLKYLNDRFDDKYTALKNAGKDPEKARRYDIFIPKDARWDKIRSKSKDTGSVLNNALSQLMEKNPKILGDLFTGIDYADPNKLDDDDLESFLQSMGSLYFGKSNSDESKYFVPESDEAIGKAYHDLVTRFATTSGSGGGDFATPKEVIRLMVKLIKPEEKMRICDPFLGAGGSLVEVAEYIKEQGGDPKNVSYYGQERIRKFWMLAKINTLIHGLLDARVERGDTIGDPKFKTDELEKFDIQLSDPPFSPKAGEHYSYEAVKNDIFGVFSYGIPTESNGVMAYFQHMITTLSDTGRMVIIVPHGVLFWGKREGKIRQNIVEDDIVDTIIGLPEKLLYGSDVPSALIILNKEKPKHKKNKILFITATEEFITGNPKNSLGENHINKIIQTYSDYERVEADEDAYERYARVVDMKEIKENDFVLNITRYVDTSEPEEEIDLEEAVQDWKLAMKERDEATKVVENYLEELGIGK